MRVPSTLSVAAEGDDVVCVWVSAFTGALPVAFVAAAGSGGGVGALPVAFVAAAGSGGGVGALTAGLSGAISEFFQWNFPECKPIAVPIPADAIPEMVDDTVLSQNVFSCFNQ